MKTLLDYIYESANPISDDAIYYKLAKHAVEWKGHLHREGFIKTYGFDPDKATRKDIIKYAKKTLTPLLDDKEEIIHRRHWDLDGLIGETEYQLMHPHYWTLVEWIKQKHKRKHDVLTVFECSNSKPYADSTQRKQTYTDIYSAFTDNACISNPGIIPLEYSHYYPFRSDEWDHFAEKPDIAKKYTWVCSARFLSYVKEMGYKHVITVFQTPYPQEWAEKLVKDNTEDAKDWIHIVNTPEFDKKMIEKYESKYKNPGLVHQRCLRFPEFIARYQRLLKECLNADEKKEFDKLLGILDLKKNSRKEYEEKLKEFNEEHGVEPYKTTEGTKESFKLLTPESNTTKSKVEKYSKYVEKLVEELPKRFEDANEDYHWHSHRVVFTPLDLLMDYNDDELIKDPDTEYWNMWEAVKKLESKSDYTALNSYCYAYDGLIKELGKEEVKKYTNKLGLTQFWDDRRSHPDK